MVPDRTLQHMRSHVKLLEAVWICELRCVYRLRRGRNAVARGSSNERAEFRQCKGVPKEEQQHDKWFLIV